MNKEKDRFHLKQEYLKSHVFYDLKGHHIQGWTEEEFKIILKRVEKLKLGVYGIDPTFKRNHFGVEVCELYGMESTNPKWYWAAFEEFKKHNKDLEYCATYHVPDELLNK
jgi:hypothetical protein